MKCVMPGHPKQGTDVDRSAWVAFHHKKSHFSHRQRCDATIRITPAAHHCQMLAMAHIYWDEDIFMYLRWVRNQERQNTVDNFIVEFFRVVKCQTSRKRRGKLISEKFLQPCTSSVPTPDQVDSEFRRWHKQTDLASVYVLHCSILLGPVFWE